MVRACVDEAALSRSELERRERVEAHLERASVLKCAQPMRASLRVASASEAHHS